MSDGSPGKGLSPLKQALLTIDRLQSRLREHEAAAADPIAITGIGCRFPGGSDSPEAFWSFLRRGGDGVREIPPERWDADALYDANPDAIGKTNARYAALLDGIDRFDPHFFAISAQEAEAMDPQQRLMLEVAWEAFEDAGLTRDSLAGSATAVFVGAYNADYLNLNTRDPMSIDEYTGTGGSLNQLSGRISYLFDLVGPCLTLDTACSSSLMAVHLAVQSLRRRECDQALAGGVNLILTPSGMIAGAKMHMLAADGRCKVFDARADGFVRGEGCGAVVLKRLSDALALGDPVYALLRGTAANQDGRSNGLTAPNQIAQESVIRAAHAAAGVRASDVGFVETHGTGTALGDPIEVEALARTLGRDRPESDACTLGAVKANIGHLETAAGIAGLIKTALVLQKGEIPAQIHFERPNPHLRLEQHPLRIPTEARAWPRGRRPRIAGVSSFGWSGSNVHAVLEEAPLAAGDAGDGDRSEPHDRAPELVVLSARSAGSLHGLAGAYLERASEASPRPDIASLAATTALRRTHFEHRLALVAGSWPELARRLDAFRAGRKSEGLEIGTTEAGRRVRVAFAFPGQGSQWIGMGRELLARPVFRDALEECSSAIASVAGWSLLDELARDEHASRLDRVEVIQPAIFGMQVALARLWQSLGIEPDALIGHSLGEVAAACVAGALGVEDAARVICERSRLVAELSEPGSMALVSLPFQEARRAVDARGGGLAVAAINGPTASVVSGPPDAVAALVRDLEGADVFCRAIRVDYASHGPGMDRLLPPLERALARIEPRAATLRMLSTVTGEALAGPELGARYWLDNLRQPVRFWPVVEALANEGIGLIVEISPHTVLAGAIEEGLRQSGRGGLAVVPSVRKSAGEHASLLGALGRLYVAGCAIRWQGLHGGRRTSSGLPRYAWDRQRYWRAPPERHRDATLRHPILHARIESPVLPASVYEGLVDPSLHPYLEHHRVFNATIAPGVLYLELAVAAAREEFGVAGPTVIEDVVYEEALALPRGARAEVQVALRPDPDGAERAAHFEVYARSSAAGHGADAWRRRASGRIRIEAAPSRRPAPARDLPEREPDLRREELYAVLRDRGLLYGPAFQGLEAIWREAGETFGRVTWPAPIEGDVGAYHFHPALLDACLHAIAGPLLEREGSDDPGVSLPIEIARLRLHAAPEGPLRVRVANALEDHARETARFDLELSDGEGRLVAEIEGLVVKRTTRLALQRATSGVFRDWTYEIGWTRRDPVPFDVRDAGLWLVCADRDHVAAPLRRALEERGGRAIVVRRGDRFEQHAADTFALRPEQREDWAELFRRLARRGPLAGAIHLWSLDRAGRRPGADGLAEPTDYESILAWVQARAMEPEADPPRLWIVTGGAQATLAAEPCAPEQAALWGLGRVLANEHPELWGGLVDLPPDAADRDVEALCHVLVGELGEDAVAIRDGECFVARLQRNADVAADSSPCAFDPDASFLVTGAFGGIGLRLCRWLAERGARHLVLAGRKGAVEESARAALRSLRESGCEVTELRIDVGDRAALAQALQRVAESGHPLRGILHAAAVLDDGVLVQQSRERFERVLRPKALGAWHLHELTRDLELDFFVLFSSAASLLGASGQSNYAAANAFLDALAQQRRAQGLPALSINWGAWSDVGLAAHLGRDLRRRLESVGLGWFTPDEGIAVLESLLRRPETQVAVLPVKWSKYLTALPSPATPSLFRSMAQAVSEGARRAARKSDLLRRLEASPESEHAGLIAAHLRSLIAESLGVPDASTIDVHAALFDVGLDSLRILELRNELQSTLGLSLPLRSVFEKPTVAAVSQLVQSLRSGHAAPAESAHADLHAEVELEPSVTAEGLPRREPASGAVLLTGATGFVGSHILKELLERDADAGHVLCLVRAENEAAATARLRSALDRYGLWREGWEHRLRPLCGDLSKPFLGLSAADYERLADEVGSVYHCGAVVNFVYPYEELRASNVQGTREILRLATRVHAKPVHFVSSIGVLDACVDAERVTEADTPPGTGFKTGYSQSKWVAERLVLEAGSRDLPVTVHRVAEVTPHSRLRVWNPNDFTYRLLRGCVTLGAVPDVRIHTNLVPVDLVARAFVTLARNPDNEGRVFHLVGPRALPFADLLAALRGRGLSLPELPYEEWRARLSSGGDPLLLTLLALLPETREQFEATLRLPVIDMRATGRALAEAGLEWPTEPSDLVAASVSALLEGPAGG